MIQTDFKVLVLASGNAGKLSELSQLLHPLGLKLRSQSGWDVPEAVENAPTFFENALIKARNAALHTGLPSLADDSGLVVPAIGGAPGIHSARYAGKRGGDRANNARLLRALDGLEGADRSAFFHCVMVLTRTADDPVPLIACASWRGEIAMSEQGSGGFGYDPLFRIADRVCTSAELSSEEKNRISHRGQASRKLIKLIRSEPGSITLKAPAHER